MPAWENFCISAIHCAIFLIAFFFVFTSSILAVNMTISGAPASINEEQEFNITVELKGSNIPKKTYYLEGVFTKKDAKPSYFGWTKNQDGIWHNHKASNALNFYKIRTSTESAWSGTLTLKPDLQDSSFKETGEYYLKVRRYTESGNPQNDNCNQLLVTINHQEPTPSPTTSSTATPIPSPTPSPSSTITPSLEPSPTAKNEIEEESSFTKASEDKEADFTGEVLGATESGDKKEEEESDENKKESKKHLTLPFTIIGSGLLFLLAGSFPFIRNFVKKKINKKKQAGNAIL